MMGFGEEGKKFPQKFFPSSPITNQPLSGTEPFTIFLTIKKPFSIYTERLGFFQGFDYSARAALRLRRIFPLRSISTTLTVT